MLIPRIYVKFTAWHQERGVKGLGLLASNHGKNIRWSRGLGVKGLGFGLSSGVHLVPVYALGQFFDQTMEFCSVRICTCYMK